MISVMNDLSLSLERPRKSPAGLPNRVCVRCEKPGCSRKCSITLRMPEMFPFAFGEKIEGVFSLLCGKLVEVDDITADLIGQQSPTSDASEVDDGSV